MVNYPRLAVNGDHACVCALTSNSSSDGRSAMLNNRASSPTVTRVRDTAYWTPYPVFTSQGDLYVTGRKGKLAVNARVIR